MVDTSQTRGALIVLDGPDGSGTTVHSRLLAERFTAEGTPVLWTAEPSTGPIGTFIREALQSSLPLPPAALQLLFSADRADHCERVIAPALASGMTVITDRYVASTVVYGQALGLDEQWLRNLNKNFIQPALTFFLLPPLSLALARLRQRTRRDALEDEDLQRRVHASYATMAQQDPSIVVIDTAGDKDAVSEHIWNRVQAFL